MNEATPQSQPERLDIESFTSCLTFPEIRVLRALAAGLAVAVRVHGRELDMATLRLRAQLDEMASLTPDQETDLPDGVEDLERRLNSETRARVGGVVSAIRRGANYSKRLLEMAIKRYPLEEATVGMPIEGELHKRFDTVLERLCGLEAKTDINVDPQGFSMGFGHIAEPLLPVVDLCDSLQERTVRQIRARHREQQMEARISVPVTEADGRTWVGGYGWLIVCDEDGEYEWSVMLCKNLSLEALPQVVKRAFLCSREEAEKISAPIIRRTLQEPAVRALLAPLNDISVLIPEFDPAKTGATSKVAAMPAATPPAPPPYTSRLDAGDLHRLRQLQEELSGYCRQGVSRFVDHLQMSQQADGFKTDIWATREFSTSLTKTDWDGLAVLECVSMAHNLAAQHEYNFARDHIRACIRGMYEVVTAKHGIVLNSVHPDAVDQLIASRRHQNYLREEVGEHSLDARLLRRLETLHRFTGKTAEEVGALHQMRLVETGISKILNRHAAVLSQNSGSPSPSIAIPSAAAGSRPVLDLRASQKGAPEARGADIPPLKSV
jgi:hypothetical protein